MNRSMPLLLALGLLLASGCNRNSGPASGSAQAGGSTSLKIVYIPKNTGNPYFTEVDRGFEDAAKEIGADYHTTGPAKADASEQIPMIKEQIQRGVDVIAISADSVDALNPVLDEARSKGITVITVDADLVGNETHRNAAVLPADFDTVGVSQIELLGKLTGYEGDFAILSAKQDAPNQNVWIEKMRQALKDPKYEKMHLVDVVYGDDEPQKSTTECEALLAKYPNLRGIISPTSVGLAAGAEVVDRAGVFPGGPHAVGKGLELTGLSTPDQLKKFVADGSVTAFQLWAPYNEGYIAVYLGQAIHDKKLTPKVDEEFETKKFGKSKFTNKLELIAGPLATFDKSNVDKFNF
jgi:rhamnose transport system substrate-binding protein